MREKLTTSHVEPKRRLDFWQSTVSEMYAPVEIKDYRKADFEAEVVSTSVGEVMISEFDGVRQTVARPKSLIKSGDCDDYVAVIQLDGTIHHMLNGRESTTMRDSIILYDLARPYELQASDHLNIIDVSIPRGELERVFGPVANVVGLGIGPEQASVPIICAYFRRLMQRAHLLDRPTAARMAAIGIDMLAAGFAEKLALGPRPGTGAATIVYRAKALIEEQLGDARLDVGKVASALNLSVRRLQEVFAENELTIDGYLWDRRLAKARARLKDPAYDALSIASVGYGVGFSSPSHFARRFRLRFGVTPSGYRDQAVSERGRGTTP